MSFRVDVAREAAKLLDRLDRPTNERIRARFRQLAIDPFDPRLSAQLTEKNGLRKSRVGSWRILFAVDRDEQVVQILTIDSRGQVYKHFS